MNSFRFKKGFSLVEMVLSMAIIGIIVGVSVPLYEQLQKNRSFDVEVQEYIAMHRKAQAFMRSGYYDAPWGISIVGNTITLFQGSSYSGRDTDFDEVLELANLVTSSDEEYIFDYRGLLSSGPFNFDFEDVLTGAVYKNITINEYGIITTQ